MQPLIFPISFDSLHSINIQPVYENNPATPLIKYGFNNISTNLIMSEITSNPYYKYGLEFDVWNETSSAITKKFDTKFKITQTFLELIELVTIFDLLQSNSNVYSNKIQEFTQLVDYKSVKKINVSDKVEKNKFDLHFHKFSDIDIDENAAIDFIIKVIPTLSTLKTGSNIVIQIFSVQTQPMVELIMYMTSMFHDGYIVKPACISDLYSMKYLVLRGMRTAVEPQAISISNSFLTSIGLEIVPEIDVSIKCMNSVLLPRKYKIYNKILAYIESGVFEGSVYQNFLDFHISNANIWYKTFVDFDPKDNAFGTIINNTHALCTSMNYPILDFFLNV